MVNNKLVAIEKILVEIKNQGISTQKELNKLKRDISKEFALKNIPTNIEIMLCLRSEQIKEFRSILLTKPTRTISGVSPVAIMTRPAKCPHGKCTYCVGGIDSPWGDVPQSYTGHEPATMRGIRNDYDAYLQVFNRLEQFVLLGQGVDKIEIIVMGGTFTATHPQYQLEFIYGVFKALNDFSSMFFDGSVIDFTKFKEFFELPANTGDKVREASIKKKLYSLKDLNYDCSDKGLLDEQIKNETSRVRSVALCIETKPDWGLLEHGNRMLAQGCTRVELGIQSVYDDVLEHVHRGHDSAVSKRSIQVLRDLGFKINFHYMPGLPLTSRERDIAGMKQIFSDPDYKPDMIKFYPCMVGPKTALYHDFKAGKFEPIGTDEAMSRILEVKKFVPRYCRIQRVQRDVPTKYWEAGVGHTNLRQMIHQKAAKDSGNDNVANGEDSSIERMCNCIRCREPKGKEVSWENVSIRVEEFEASGGVEFFIEAYDSKNDYIIGFCRLRFPKEFLRPEIVSGSCLIRELHVYGSATAIGDDGDVQHKGWGQKLMIKAQEIARLHGKTKMVVISGVGVREYYVKKLGFVKQGPYVVKDL
jgi:elongator complex protein 3